MVLSGGAAAALGGAAALEGLRFIGAGVSMSFGITIIGLWAFGAVGACFAVTCWLSKTV